MITQQFSECIQDRYQRTRECTLIPRLQVRVLSGAQMVQMHPNCQLLGTRPRRRECLPPLASVPKAKHAHRATGAISSLAGLPVRSQYRFGPHRAALIQREYLTRQYQPSSLCSCQKYIPRRHTLQQYFTDSCMIGLTWNMSQWHI